MVTERRKSALHLWIASLAILALAVLYPLETLTARRAAVGTETAFSLPGGYYDHDIRLEIIAPVLDDGRQASTLFTVDGSIPTDATGTVYTQPIHLSASVPTVAVVRARAVLLDGRLGPVVSASYFIGARATLPMMSLIVDPDDLWNSEWGIYANPYERGDEWERPVDVAYVDKDRRSGFHIAAGVRIHGQGNPISDKESLRLYFRQEYGASRLEYPLFAGSEVQSFKRLVLHNGGQDSPLPDLNWTLVRNWLADTLALQLDGCATHTQPVLVFVNGEPWGIYQLRERIDRHFLADHYDIESADFLDSPEHAEEQDVLMGDRESWDRLMQFVENHDLADPANYAYVQSQVDVENLVDYNILQIYAANTDWPRRNVFQFRPRVQGGRWRWMVWDSDSGFDARSVAPWRSTGPNLVKYMLEYDHPDTGGRDALLLRKLLDNPVFRQRFLSRAADLLNTALSPESVIGHIDDMAAELEPDIAYETLRWPSSTDWGANVQGLRDFALYRADLVRQYLVGAFGLDGTAQLTFNPPASGSGTVAVNGSLIQDLPWQGVYFQGVPIQITAVSMPGYRFAGWDPPEIPQIPVVTLSPGAAQAVTPRFEPVGADIPQPGDVVFGQYHPGDDSHVEGWSFELQVTRPGGLDLRGWRVTDNDTKTATDEGSLIFADPAFARVPQDTRILIVGGAREDTPDDLSLWDRRMVLYVGNGGLDATIDPGFNLGPNDSLALLAPGPTDAFGDDLGIAFAAGSSTVTPASFGVLADGVLPAPTTADPQPGQ